MKKIFSVFELGHVSNLIFTTFYTLWFFANGLLSDEGFWKQLLYYGFGIFYAIWMTFSFKKWRKKKIKNEEMH